MRHLVALWADDGGTTAVEYAIMVAAIAVAIVTGAGLLGTHVRGLFVQAGARWP